MIGFDAKNRRRIDLIEKKYREGLTPAEFRELERLHGEVHEYLRRRYPREATVLDEFTAYVAELRARMARKGARS